MAAIPLHSWRTFYKDLAPIFRTNNFISSELQDVVPSLAHMTIYPGILTGLSKLHIPNRREGH